MKILILTQFFPPEVGAAQNRLYDLACRLSVRGHSITVVTSLPSYPEGVIYDGYTGRFVMSENHKGFRIVRTWLFTTKKKSFVLRILNYLSFSTLSCFVGFFAAGPVDVVFVESPPLFLGVFGYLLSKLKRARFVLNISDLWPESAVALGLLQNERLIRWTTRVEEGLYHRARIVTGQTQGIVDSIHRRCPSTPVALCTNGVAPEFIQRAQECREVRECTRASLGLNGKFVVGYAGLHGLVYGLDDLLDVAKVLAHATDVVFLLIGDGPEKARLEARSRREQIDNVFFYPSQPVSRMPELLTAMDVSLIALRQHKLFKGTLPSKLFEAMGAGVPVVAAMEGEARFVIEKSQCGICVEPEDVPEIAKALMQLYCDPVLGQNLGAKGCDYVLKHYNREATAQRYENIFLDVVSRSESCSEGNHKLLADNSLHADSLGPMGPKCPKAGD
jgi:glycosyltransferase involved in cell wall biosynthesis